LIQPPGQPVVPLTVLPAPEEGKTTDDLIQRLGKELKEQPPATQGPAAKVPVTPATTQAGSSTPGTVEKPPVAPPILAKAPPEKACGPDVTDYVLAVLQMIEDAYKNSWKPEERAARCSSLYGLGFQAAWDMQGFAPSDGEDYMPEIFFQRAAPQYCAIPRDPCGSTVVFLGYCISAQVVNYVQWGLMNELCGTQVKGRIAQSTRSFFSSNSVGQEAMSDIGADFAGSLDLATKKRVLKNILDQLVRDHETDWYKMGGTDCPLVCDQSLAGPWLENFSWGFQWGPEEVPITKRGYELKKP
jgi:hypothetical protein